MRRLGLGSWMEELMTFRRSALHVEQHGYYAGDLAAMAPWLAGATDPPALGQGPDRWADQTVPLLRNGASIERLRIHADEPTPYQHWLRWISPRRLDAGEVHRYLWASVAEEAKLLPVPPVAGCDWWLLDDVRLLVLHHDGGGQLVDVAITDAPDPVAAARSWWQRAIGHAVAEPRLVPAPPG